MSSFKLTIDGVVVEAEQGMTVLQAAKRAGLFIPSLCAHDELSPYGACRLCVVEIDGIRGTPTSCTTPAAEGMVVRTNTEQLQTQRRRTIELMMSGHPSPCFSCDSREDCEIEKSTPTKAGIATRCGACSNRPGCELRGVAMGSFTRDIDLPLLYSIDKIERDDPFIDKDHNLCILCGRCFRTCEKIHDKPAISIANRGKKAKISVAFEKTWSSEECRFCGTCVDECPTGCLTDRWGKWFGVQDSLAESVCTLCPSHCKLMLKIKQGKIIGAKMLSLKKENAICALGKFALAQIVNSPRRISRIQVKIGGEQIPSGFDEAVAKIKSLFEVSKGGKLVVSSRDAYVETRKGLRALAAKYGADFVELASNAESLGEQTLSKIENGEYDTALVLGNWLSAENAKKIKHLVIADFAKSAAQKFAEVVIPVSITGETSATVAGADGTPLGCAKVSEPALDRRATFEYLSAVVGDFSGGEFELESLSADFASPALDKKNLPNKFFGHYLSDFAPDLLKLGLSKSPEASEIENSKSGFEILEKRMLVPNFHAIKISAPDAAKYVKPGQFAILMANANSERSPFTIIDWNAEEGWIEFIVEEVGRSSSELGALNKGDKIAVMSGPLGTPVDLERFAPGSSALLLGGCYGIGAIYSIARALKEKGVKTTCAIEASTSYMLYFKDKLASVSDELIVKTRDGTEGTKGGCSNVLAEIGSNFDSIVAIGCVFMMKQCAGSAPKDDSKTQLCALNPIMVDGTGMCGACRVNVGGETKFACVEGPFFPLLKVDFNELGKRRTAYKLLEIEAMPRHIGGKCHS